MLRTWRDILAINGSGEHKSIQGLEYAISWETISPNTKGVSKESKKEMIETNGRTQLNKSTL
jgi:hypothetical protein